MDPIHAHIRTAGHGPAILCLHSSAGSGNQWQALTDLTADRHCLITPDLIGYGRTAAWLNERPLSLIDEVSALAHVLAESDPTHVVGHSFGAAVALELALLHPAKVRSLTLYEPVRFHLLNDHPRSTVLLPEVIELSTDVCRHIEDENQYAAAKRFVSYWSGDKAWEKLSRQQQERLASYMPQVVFDFDAVLRSTVPLNAFRALTMPTLFIVGAKSPLPTQRITRLLVDTIPNARLVIAPATGHMGPVTHPRLINPVIEAYVQQWHFCAVPATLLPAEVGLWHAGPENYELSA